MGNYIEKIIAFRNIFILLYAYQLSGYALFFERSPVKLVTIIMFLLCSMLIIISRVYCREARLKKKKLVNQVCFYKIYFSVFFLIFVIDLVEKN